MVAADPAGDALERFVGELLRRFGRRLHALAEALLEDDLRNDADEVVQEAIEVTTISASSGKLRHLSSGNMGQLTVCEPAAAAMKARAYLWGTVVRICSVRNKKKRPLLEEDAGKGVAGREMDAFDAIIAAETKSEVWAALRALPIKDQQVLVLRFIEGFSYKTIAAAAGIPVGTVKSRISRACRRARRTESFKRLYTTLYPDEAPKGRWP